MSDINNGKIAIKEFLKANNISEIDLATAYGKSREWVQRALNGADKGRAVNNFVITVIRDYKIR